MIAGASLPTWQQGVAARPLPESAVRALVDFAAAHPSVLRSPAELMASPAALDPLLPTVEWIRGALSTGEGFAAVSTGSLGLAYARLAFGVLGVMLAPPIDRYGFHYAVADTGESYEEKAIPISKTRASTGLHTDSTRLRARHRRASVRTPKYRRRDVADRGCVRRLPLDRSEPARDRPGAPAFILKEDRHAGSRQGPRLAAPESLPHRSLGAPI